MYLKRSSYAGAIALPASFKILGWILSGSIDFFTRSFPILHIAEFSERENKDNEGPSPVAGLMGSMWLLIGRGSKPFSVSPIEAK